MYRSSETGIGGVKTYRTLEGGGTRPESCPCKAWTFFLTPKLRIFYRNSVRKGQISGAPKSQNFHPPPLIFGDLTPPLSRSPIVVHLEGLERHPNAARQELPRDDFCRSIIELPHKYHWGQQKHDLPNFYSRRIILGIVLGNVFVLNVPSPQGQVLKEEKKTSLAGEVWDAF